MPDAEKLKSGMLRPGYSGFEGIGIGKGKNRKRVTPFRIEHCSFIHLLMDSQLCQKLRRGASAREGESGRVANSKVAGFIRVGIWGRQRQSGGPQNNWSFELESDHRLQKITIDHGDDGIYSLMFTTKCEDIFQTSNKVGGWAGGQTVSEVTFEINEEIVGIKGSVGTRGGYTIISLLSFKTNERTHGPFGGTSDAHNEFTIPWDKGSLVGFYGIAGDYIDGIGVYVKAHEEIMRIGTWGRSDAGEPRNVWSFKLERNHRLKKITVDHGDLIYSLMFTTQYRGLTHDYNKIGGWNGGDKVSKVTFQINEEIVGIKGSVGTRGGYKIISLLSFETNKRTYGPFGGTSDAHNEFTIPWDKGSLVGFYGIAGDYIDGIGIYVKAHEEIMRIGTWGRSDAGEPRNVWSFKLERNHRLKKITVDHGDLIYSLMFTTQYRGLTHDYNKIGGWNGGDKVSEVTFDCVEEIIAISGTVELSRGPYAGYTIISSLSFVTNKKTHGPFGNVRGKPFMVPWDDGSFDGFYGLCGYYLDSIGVSLKATIAEFVRIGTWGRQNGSPQNKWSFELEPDHSLQKITIDHGDDVIYSLMFTYQHEGVLQYSSSKAGGYAHEQTVTFEIDEEIIGIKGRVGTRGGYAIISSLSFETNKRTHGPFGGTSNSHEFSIPWDNSGSLVGFYGIAGYYIDEIGVYVKAREEIMRIGTWGSSNPDGEYAFWSFKLESNHHLKMITVDHGDLIYSLMFTTQYRGLTHNYKTVGGWNGGDKVSEVKSYKLT
ncbi:hypothetical protein E3N88_00878 [Mikania micrantha]|uniref:Jacalin-type lectin domain-containing protein n=1 Tax=Mikania micrantha TaxID=192012 RepID=A0A5N6PZP6_9ASTR|nr:hypothetical protein E3N88_00878 [Mikania micrantha]